MGQAPLRAPFFGERGRCDARNSLGCVTQCGYFEEGGISHPQRQVRQIVQLQVERRRLPAVIRTTSRVTARPTSRRKATRTVLEQARGAVGRLDGVSPVGRTVSEAECDETPVGGAAWDIDRAGILVRPGYGST